MPYQLNFLEFAFCAFLWRGWYNNTTEKEKSACRANFALFGVLIDEACSL